MTGFLVLSARHFLSLRWRSLMPLVAMFLLALPAATAFAALGSFQKVETETFDEEEFIFPDDLSADALNVVMLAISKDQDNGSLQGDELLEWYLTLDEAGVLSDEVVAWNFSVIKAPFFVKGLIRRGIAGSNEGIVPFNQGGVIFTKDIEKFASMAGIPLDGQPTIVLVAADGELLELIKGEASPEKVAAVVEAIAGYTNGVVPQ